MLKKPVKPVEVPIKFPEQQAPPATKDCAKSEDQPPDPIDPGRKEPIPTDADPVVKPAQSAVPKPDANFSAPPFWILGTLGGQTVGTYRSTDASRPFELMRVRCSYVLLNSYYLLDSQKSTITPTYICSVVASRTSTRTPNKKRIFIFRICTVNHEPPLST